MMAPREKRGRTKQRKNFKKKPPKGKGKRNKSFSVHQRRVQVEQTLQKRKFKNEDSANLKSKRQKPENQQLQTEDESFADEEEDHMKQLLGTFGGSLISKVTAAIDSSDDSESDEDNDTVNDVDSNPKDNRIGEEEVSDSDLESDQDLAENIGVSDVENEDGKEQLPSEGECIGSEDVAGNKDELKNSQQSASIAIGDTEISNTLEKTFKESDELDPETQKEDEDTTGSLEDPFARHLFYEMNDSLLASIQSTPILATNHSADWQVLGKLHIQIPKCEKILKSTASFRISEEKPYAPSGSVPSRIVNSSLESVHIKTQITGNIVTANKGIRNLNSKLLLSPLQSEIFAIINNYQDFYCTQRTFENAEEIRFVYSLHIVNHILKTRTKVLHHNARLSKKDEVPEEFRDQGLVRPKVLVIVPFRDSAFRIISMLTDILIPEDKGNVMNKNRFLEEFTGHELAMPKKNRKPEDYETLFSGNTGDDFRIGITVTKKSLKLFADFYSADIIIASPLGLRTVIGADGEPDRDYDFLASIELLILDQTEVFLMQNWDHLLHVLNHLHLQPKESHGTDFARVRTWSLNGWAKYYRQTLIFSSLALPDINAIFNKKCFNYAGKIKTVNVIPFGTICQVFVQLPHVFNKFSADAVSQLTDDRFHFFVRNILPQQRETLMRQTLIFVSNYFDYVRLRNYFKREDVSFVQICEYSKEGKVARARDMFFHGDAHFLLYTERFHFFNRVRIKGIRHLVFYQPPLFPHFYYELCNLMQEANMNKKVGNMSNMTVTVLYSKYDVHQLAAIVGTARAAKMVQSERNVHMLVTDGK